MGKSASSPQPVDPYQAANAQYQYGTAAAAFNRGLNATDVNTPYGSTTWSVNGQPLGGGSDQYGSPGGNYGTDGSGGAPTGADLNMEVSPGFSRGGPATTTGPAQPGSYNPATGGTVDVPGYGTISIPGQSSGVGVGGLPTSMGGGGSYVPPNAPHYTETQTLSPVEQEIFNLGNEGQIGQLRAAGGEQQTAGELMPQVQRNLLNQPDLQTSVPGSGDLGGQYDKAFNTALRGNLAAVTPTLNAQYEQLDSSLKNQGIHPGDPAYETAMSQFTANEGNVLNEAGGAATNTGINLENTLFGQGLQSTEFGNAAKIQQQQLPLQNYLALEGGPAPSSAPPSFGFGGSGGGGGGAGVNAPDLMSAFQNYYQGQLNSANAQNAANNANIGAGASILGSIIAAFA